MKHEKREPNPKETCMKDSTCPEFIRNTGKNLNNHINPIKCFSIIQPWNLHP